MNIVKSNPKVLYVLPFILSWVYWIYLLNTAQMELVFDALGYHDFARQMYQQGWLEYFKTGPNREPFYLFLIRFSMQLGDAVAVPYKTIQTFIQILFLFASQLLAFRLLKKLRIKPILISLTILYMGFSPALVNSVFSLFSEIVTYPFILGIVLVSAQAWQSLKDCSKGKTIFLGILFGLLFLLATFTKALIGYVFCLFFIPFFYILIKAIQARHLRLLQNTSLFILASIVTFNIVMVNFKLMNQKYNGHYIFADARGYWFLYGSTARRVQPITPKKFLVATTTTMGDGFCHSIFSKGECDYWALGRVDNYGAIKLGELHRSVGEDGINPGLIQATLDDIWAHPFQYPLMTLVDAARMFFWESTHLGCVFYPSWLQRIYDFTPFYFSLRGLMAILTILALFYMAFKIIRERKKLFNLSGSPEEEISILFFALLMIGEFIIMYSFFYILTRYMLPIVSLYLVAIAYFLHAILESKE